MALGRPELPPWIRGRKHTAKDFPPAAGWSTVRDKPREKTGSVEEVGSLFQSIREIR